MSETRWNNGGDCTLTCFLLHCCTELNSSTERQSERKQRKKENKAVHIMGRERERVWDSQSEWKWERDTQNKQVCIDSMLWWSGEFRLRAVKRCMCGSRGMNSVSSLCRYSALCPWELKWLSWYPRGKQNQENDFSNGKKKKKIDYFDGFRGIRDDEVLIQGINWTPYAIIKGRIEQI